MITRVRVKNFLSLFDIDVRLDPLTVLIGRSSTGKSNFLRAIKLVKDVLLSGQSGLMHSKQFFTKAKDACEITLDLRLSNSNTHYTYSLRIDTSKQLQEYLAKDDVLVFSRIGTQWKHAPKIANLPTIDKQNTALNLLTSIRDVKIVYLLLTMGVGYYEFPSNVLQLKKEDPRHELSIDAGNYLTVCGRLMDTLSRLTDWDTIEKSMKSYSSNLSNLALKLPERSEIQFGITIDELVHYFDVSNESEGFRRFLAHIIALYQEPRKQIFLFEHPETGLHPAAVSSLCSLFSDQVDRQNSQIIFTTHSPEILDQYRDRPECIRVFDSVNHRTRVGPVSKEQVAEIKENLLLPRELFIVDPARIDGHSVTS